MQKGGLQIFDFAPLSVIRTNRVRVCVIICCIAGIRTTRCATLAFATLISAIGTARMDRYLCRRERSRRRVVHKLMQQQQWKRASKQEARRPDRPACNRPPQSYPARRGDGDRDPTLLLKVLAACSRTSELSPTRPKTRKEASVISYKKE